jgi:segregation and condensation protein A
VAYEVSTPVFEGPFDLLLHLITRDQVDIYDVSISAIVDAYLAELDKMRSFDLDVATEFLLIAATLIELKLRRLLPGRDDVDLDEELALLEERDLLLAKLLEYRTFKFAALEIERRIAAAATSLPHPGGLDDRFVDLAPDVLAGVTPERLRAAYVAALMRALTPKPEPRVSLAHVTDIRLTVAEIARDLAMTLPTRGRVSFRELTDACEHRVEIIVHFLALLELCKQGWVDLDQTKSFADLLVSWRPGGPEADEVDAAMNELISDAERDAMARAAASSADPGDDSDSAAERVAAALGEIDSYEG